MKERAIRSLTVSEIGMGCMAFSHGYGQIPTEEYSIQAIQQAFANGCTFFDTAEIYSPNLSGVGHNERIVGKALHAVRDQVVLATKFFVSPSEVREAGTVYQAIRQHLLASLQRLQTDYIDLYYLHRLGSVPIEEIARAMGKLIDEGLVKEWGLSQVDVPTIRRAHQVQPLAAVQNIYSMVERDMEEAVIPYCLENGIAVIPFSPIASGLLSGRITQQTQFESRDDVRNWVPQLSRRNRKNNQPIVDLVSEFAQRKQATAAQISLAWMLHKYPNVIPIPGSKNQERILENLGASGISLTEEEFAELDSRLNELPVYGHRGFMR